MKSKGQKANSSRKKSTRSQKETMTRLPKNGSTPQKCTKCPGQPLHVQCPHTKAGQLYLASQDMDISPIVAEPDGDENATINHFLSPPEAIPTTRSQRRCNVCTDQPLHSQCPHTKAGQNYLTLKSLDLDTSPGVAEPGGYENSAHAPNLPAADKDVLPLSSDPASTDESVTVLTSPPGLIDNHFIDSVLLAMDPSESSPTHLATDADITSCMIFIDPVLTMNPSDSSSALPAHTNKNSYDPRLVNFLEHRKPVTMEENEKCFETVEDVQWGSLNYKIVRTKKLEPEILDCASASQHFNRDIGPIIAKMERLSLSTGAWVLLLAHHTGESSGAIHFVSKTLHNEANSECVDLANFFMKLTSKLKQARVANSHSLMKELEARTQELDEKNKELERKEKEIEEQRTQLLQMTGLLGSAVAN
ncbi:hypothetical protein BDQ17DRAFT_1428441 [Cyathus striatus]|nr:hypothetical protein BDQ17DRAFT_1428441 [Cyathus striatus]